MRAPLALTALCAGLASAKQYVVFSEVNTTNTPSARALASYALQTTTLEETGALGTFVWRFGGKFATGAERATDELFVLDMQTMQWRERTDVAGDTPTARRGASLSFAAATGSAYLFGGENAQQTKLGELDALQLGSSTAHTPQWQRVALAAGSANPPARSEHTATVVTLHHRAGEPTGLLVFGGAGASGYLADLFEFDIDWRVWTAPADVSGAPPSARKSHAAAHLLGSTVVIVGGEGGAGAYYDDVHLYDVARKHWSQPTRDTAEGSYPPERAGHVVQVVNEVVYMFGGHNFGVVHSDLWSFSAPLAAAGRVRWTSPTPMSASPSARWGHSSLLNLNTQLLFGGHDANDNTIADMWTMTPGCGESLTMTESLGRFSDGDDSYVAGMDCAWLLQPAAAHANVMLIVTAIDLPDRDDRLLVYDGTTADAAQIASFTGTDIPPPVTSSGGAMFVRFVATHNGGLGFDASYQVVCAAGYEWNEASRLCSACPSGYYAPYSGMIDCLPCPQGTYSLSAGQAACTSCPDFSSTSIQAATGVGDCACQLGYVGIGDRCEPCPTGASCPGGSVIRAVKGWCQQAELSSAILPQFEHCCDPSECPGGAGARCDDSVALLGTGNDCAVRYLSWDTISQVSLSAGTWASVGAILGMSLVLFLAFGLLVGYKVAKIKYMPKPGFQLGRAKIDVENPVLATALAPQMMTVAPPAEPAAPSWLPTPDDGAPSNDIFTPRAAPAAADGVHVPANARPAPTDGRAPGQSADDYAGGGQQRGSGGCSPTPREYGAPGACWDPTEAYDGANEASSGFTSGADGGYVGGSGVTSYMSSAQQGASHVGSHAGSNVGSANNGYGGDSRHSTPPLDEGGLVILDINQLDDGAGVGGVGADAPDYADVSGYASGASAQLTALEEEASDAASGA